MSDPDRYINPRFVAEAMAENATNFKRMADAAEASSKPAKSSNGGMWVKITLSLLGPLIVLAAAIISLITRFGK